MRSYHFAIQLENDQKRHFVSIKSLFDKSCMKLNFGFNGPTELFLCADN